MADEQSKYGGLAAFRQEVIATSPKPKVEKPAKPIHVAQPSNTSAGRAGEINLPQKTKPVGKRSNAEFRQKTVLLRIETITAAESRLEEMQTGNDFSELTQALLEQWLNRP